MRAVKDGFYQGINATSAITSRLATYRSKPAIFTRRPVPEDAAMPYVVIDDAVNDEPYDTKTTVGREVLHDIGVFTDDNGNPELVEDIAERIRDLFHRNPVTVSGYGSFIAIATGPMVAPTEDQIYGRIVQVQLTAIKQS